MPSLQHPRGLLAALPTSGMLSGQVYFTTDRGSAHLATDATHTLDIVPAIDRMVAMGAVDLAADLLVIHDASATGQKEKRITIDALKSALNIPEGSADEKVAVVSGGTAGYLWGTDGTDGILRMNTSLAWAKDAGNGYVTLSVGVIDCGTF